MGLHLRNSRYEFKCDGCDEYFASNEQNIIDAAIKARTQGWGMLHPHGKVQEWYCATCAIKMGAD